MNLSKDTKFRWLILSLVLVAIFEVLSLSGWDLPHVIAIPLFLSIILFIGHQTLLEGFQALFQLNFKSINFLMTIAVIGAFYLEKYEEAAIVIVLYNLAEKLEDLGIQQSKTSLSSLAEKMPKVAFIKGRDFSIPVSQVKIDDVLVVKPGEMIPLDGEVLLGFTAVDEATITGEPIAKDKMVGDFVFAGTLNKQGYIEVKVTKLAKDTTLAKIQEITLQAFQAKAHTQKFIETFSSYYTPSVILLAFLWMIIPPYFFLTPFNQSFQNALTLLVIACPCALVISTPVSIYSALGNAASKGILIKGGRYLEAIGKIKAIALDKTRTLTFGNPIVTDVIPFGSNTKEHLLSCAAGIEVQSEHPLAKSIVQAAKEEKYVPHSIENFQIKIGKGAQADCLVCEDKHHCIGKLEFILEEHHVPQEVIEKIDLLQKEGKTAILICTHKEVEGVIGLLDEVRPESKQVILDIKNLGVTPVMLTGDNLTSAQAIAKMIDITDVKASLLPEDKAKEIQALLYKYKSVAMVGDGINDAPALALSSVGITMSELGSDTAIEAASIVILSDYLNRIPFLIKLGRKALQTIRLNIFLAIAIKLIFISLALFGMSNLALAIFADVGVTVIVILNSLRLARA
uniref:P-type Zn(2+) transporter n=1 Tax=Candidatus Criblamydia sequanensis CRIB-18 TaxID=1437425 RepID=A0A090D1K5_9BACT|nr:cation-translocating P-type ATPase [Criblamydia sequanensis]CDR35297.1 Cadmium-translocating P-type ATPase [Criblamydia sequanensis CRIB-18]